MRQYRLQEEVQQYHFSSEFKFGPKNGFNVAATVYGMDGDLSLNERIGAVKFYLKRWTDALGRNFEFLPLRQRACTQEDFNQEDAREFGGFYPLREKFKGYEYLESKMECLDENYELYGDFDSFAASNLMIVFEICDK